MLHAYETYTYLLLENLHKNELLCEYTTLDTTYYIYIYTLGTQYSSLVST